MSKPPLHEVQVAPSLRRSSWFGRDFVLILSGQAASMQGDGLAGFTLLWWIAHETGSVGIATLVALLAMLPVIVLGPVAGVVVDRYSRRSLMMLADLVRAAGSGFLAWGMLTGRLEMWMLLAAATASAACTAFHRPSLQAAIAQLVPESGLNRANSLFQMAEAAANLIAPAVGGMLVAWLGSGVAMAITSLLSAAAAGTLLLARIPPLPPKPNAAPTSPARAKRFLSEMGAGLAYLWRGQRMLFFMLCTFALVNFALAPIGPLLPFIAEQRLGLDATGLGFLMSGIPAGMMAGAMLMSVIGPRLRRGPSVIWGIAAVGLTLVAASQLRSPTAAFGALAAAGACVSVVGVSANGLFQTLVPKEMHGRVFAVRSSVAQAASPLSLALVGALSGAVAPHTLLLIGGVLVAAAGFVGYTVPGLSSAK